MVVAAVVVEWWCSGVAAWWAHNPIGAPDVCAREDTERRQRERGTERERERERERESRAIAEVALLSAPGRHCLPAVPTVLLRL